MLKVRLTQRTIEADGVLGLELQALDGKDLPPFTAGAHIDVHLQNNLVRQYSLRGATQDRRRYLLGIYRDPQSRGGSSFVHEALAEGDELTISEPRNHFPLAEGSSVSLLFAGGIGITPLLCMAAELDRRGEDFAMHYCGRSASRMAFADELRAASYSERVRIHLDDGPEQQRLDAPAAIGAWQPGKHLYVCGPAGFMEFILSTARQAGWPDAALHREYFAAPQAETSENRAFEIELRSSGRVIEVPASMTAADALLNEGVDVPLSCEQGICGTCLIKVMAGVPDHRDTFLTEQERQRNDCFTPCCSRALTERLVLDL